MAERQSIAQKGVRAIDARNSWLENGSNAAKTSVRERMSVNTLLCDTLGLTERNLFRDPVAIIAQDPATCRETGSI